MTGWDEFIDVIKNFRLLSVIAIGTGGIVPFRCLTLARPIPAVATKRHILFMLAVIWLLLTLLYLSMFSMFTYTTEPAHQRLVAGFICLPEIKQIPDYAVKCPFLGGEEMS